MILVVCLRSWEEMANNPQYKKNRISIMFIYNIIE